MSAINRAKIIDDAFHLMMLMCPHFGNLPNIYRKRQIMQHGIQ